MPRLRPLVASMIVLLWVLCHRKYRHRVADSLDAARIRAVYEPDLCEQRYAVLAPTAIFDELRLW